MAGELGVLDSAVTRQFMYLAIVYSRDFENWKFSYLGILSYIRLQIKHDIVLGQSKGLKIKYEIDMIIA